MASSYSDSVKRSIVKSFSWRFIVVASDMVVIYALTHRLDLALSVMIATNVASMLLYYFHERIWNGVTWGRKRR